MTRFYRVAPNTLFDVTPQLFTRQQLFNMIRPTPNEPFERQTLQDIITSISRAYASGDVTTAKQLVNQNVATIRSILDIEADVPDE